MLLIEWTASAKLDLPEILDYMLFESAVPNLLQDIGVACFVNFECFAAVGADDFMHIPNVLLFESCRLKDHYGEYVCPR